MAGKGQM